MDLISKERLRPGTSLLKSGEGSEVFPALSGESLCLVGVSLTAPPTGVPSLRVRGDVRIPSL